MSSKLISVCYLYILLQTKINVMSLLKDYILYVLFYKIVLIIIFFQFSSNHILTFIYFLYIRFTIDR